jgi:hypothetical protein
MSMDFSVCRPVENYDGADRGTVSEMTFGDFDERNHVLARPLTGPCLDMAT